ncbi:MAG: hypothetical protein B7Z60_10130, partial [Ferrovum sp. 37-45-19]
MALAFCEEHAVQEAGGGVEGGLLGDFRRQKPMGQGRLHDEDACQKAVEVHGRDLLVDQRGRLAPEVLGLKELLDKFEELLLFPSEAVEPAQVA